MQLKKKPVVCLDTDKAVHPVNAISMTKDTEKLHLGNSDNTKITITRYGNAISSRGSVILF